VEDGEQVDAGVEVAGEQHAGVDQEGGSLLHPGDEQDDATAGVGAVGVLVGTTELRRKENGCG
jgi:hypothetical protein